MTSADRQEPVERRRRRRSFAEIFWLWIVLPVVCLLIGTGVFIYFGPGSFPWEGPNQRYIRANSDIEVIKTQLQMYETLNNSLPSTGQGLMALVEQPTGDPQPRKWRQLLPEVPRDPWYTPYQYRYPAKKSTMDPYDLFSAGKDRLPDTEDDIGNW